jgi:phosphoribosyl 1,2-cyclic phosphodiesterase/ActR/RegA family two-component response regulator
MPTLPELHFLIVDDNQLMAEIHKDILEDAGYKVTIITSSKDALGQIPALAPDCILCDLLMPDMDGLDLFQNLRKMQNVKQPTFIILTGKIYDFDRRQAFNVGVSGYLTKPVNPETFVSDVLEIMNESITIQFWGVRGTLPVPGKLTTVYGGNTNCVTLSFAKKQFFIFDAGTGIKELSNHLLKEKKFPMSAKIFISHPHYDHINGFPFFVPLYMKGNEFEILGANHGTAGIQKLISDQMECVYFPITMKEFAANLTFRNLAEESFDIDDLHIQTMLLNHPGRCLGYRIQHKDKSFCYITDNEIYLEDSPQHNQFEVDRLVHFINEASFVVMDATYTDAEYKQKMGWGHSSLSRVVEIADKANVKTLCLYHHDPDQFDKDIDLKLAEANAILKARKSKMHCVAAREGDRVLL